MPGTSGSCELVLTPVSFDRLPGWKGADFSGVGAAVSRWLSALGTNKNKTELFATWQLSAKDTHSRVNVTWDDWLAIVRPLADGGSLARLLEIFFIPCAVTIGKKTDTGLFTGYYEPELEGSFVRGPGYRVPLYRRPPDLVQAAGDTLGATVYGRFDDGRLVPYYDRWMIDIKGALEGRGLALIYVADPIGAFFLHIQGSGRVRLPCGVVIRVGFDGVNGHPYVALGQLLVAEGKISAATLSMQTIRAWLYAHPTEAAIMMARNPRYVFFRITDGEGPIGTGGTVLTPGRSLAVDTSFIPLGQLVWVDTPVVQGLMITQDTGGAIRGPLRGDIFCGHGTVAEDQAGRMGATGRMWVLLPRRFPVSAIS